MKLLRGTITRLQREIEIKSKKITRLKEKRSMIEAEIDAEINEVSDLSSLIAQSNGSAAEAA